MKTHKHNGETLERSAKEEKPKTRLIDRCSGDATVAAYGKVQ